MIIKREIRYLYPDETLMEKGQIVDITMNNNEKISGRITGFTNGGNENVVELMLDTSKEFQSTSRCISVKYIVFLKVLKP